MELGSNVDRVSDSESPVKLVLANGRVVCCDNELDCEALNPESVCDGRSLCDVSIAEGADGWVPLAELEDKIGPPVTDNCDGDSPLVENAPKSVDIEIPAGVEISVRVETSVGVEIPPAVEIPIDVGTPVDVEIPVSVEIPVDIEPPEPSSEDATLD